MYKEASDEFKKRLSTTSSSSGALDFGSVMEELLKNRNVQELAREAGISRTEIYHILSRRKKFAGLETLRKLARSLGIELWKLVALTEGRRHENVYFSDAEAEFTAQFKKEGVLLSSDIPPNKDLFVGRLVLDPAAQISEKLASGCLIFLRPVSAAVEITVEGRTRTLNVNEKVLFNAGLHHNIRNPSRVSKSTALFITAPSFWSLCLTE